MTRGVRLAKHVWIFGGQERGDKTKMFCCIVEKRDLAGYNAPEPKAAKKRKARDEESQGNSDNEDDF
ncbi:hypothetical protein PRIPAC_75680 [Pristionchus pacificus]|uniref:Uncharacterized protein n=1 Tax=Pristionchus pacificus TaxID=54126 RepID=A0A2A6CZU1_PRIPA|nr:hypothetical protein PRIPAC_75680 [Pristionchus pacificus]|eukprot:PDM83630.1 hypothetical protein PRIPAC_30117 [Pristionchus pacificus]